LEEGLGSIPPYVYKSVGDFGKSIEATVRDTLEQGLNGWQVTDCVVTMTHSGYSPPGNSARDFRYMDRWS
jgi:ribosomal protection tetracycline resistance protein